MFHEIRGAGSLLQTRWQHQILFVGALIVVLFQQPTCSLVPSLTLWRWTRSALLKGFHTMDSRSSMVKPVKIASQSGTLRPTNETVILSSIFACECFSLFTKTLKNIYYLISTK